MVTEYFIWWYGEGVSYSWRVASAVLYSVSDFFSLPTLLRTLFAPWKNDVIAVRNAALGDQFKIWQMNLVSRLVGFIVRSIIIAVCLLMLGLLCIVESILLVLWLVGPMLVFLLPIIGIIIVSR